MRVRARKLAAARSTRYNIDIHSGETMALLGPNGSGKSTLLRVLTTALVPTSGAVRVGDVRPWHNTRLPCAANWGSSFKIPHLTGK